VPSHRMNRGLTAVVAVAAVAASCSLLPAAAATVRAAGATAAAGRVRAGANPAFTITRNSYGVPSITAATLQGMWFGDGYAQAEDRLVQLELTRRAVEGTLSAIFGSSQLSQDETVRTFFYTPAELTAQYNSLPAVDQQALTAFSDGINAYETFAYSDPATLVPYEFFALGHLLGLPAGTPYRPAPWTPEDTVAVGNSLAR